MSSNGAAARALFLEAARAVRLPSKSRLVMPVGIILCEHAHAVWILILGCISLLSAAVLQPADWVPMRWPYSDVESLELLAGGPINCLLIKNIDPSFSTAAAQRGIATLAVITADEDRITALRNAARVKPAGIVLEGNSPYETAATLPVIALTARSGLRLTSPVAGTYQGVWPGVEILESGAIKAGPTGSAWIDTNTGFLRLVRAGYSGVFWIANSPPPRTIITADRYLQVIADAACAGARWVVALDDDFAARLHRRQPQVLDGWRRMLEMVRYLTCSQPVKGQRGRSRGKC